MKGAVLGNGPSRVAYQHASQYDFVIGCNIPWTKVDATVVLDRNIIDVWAGDPTTITVPVYFSKSAWDEVVQRNLVDLCKPYFVELLTTDPTHHSSGHNAAEILIRKGVGVIDIYGCDSWFGGSVDSYTRQFVDFGGPNYVSRQHYLGIGWRGRWQQMIADNPSVKFNFIRGPKL